MTTPPMDATFSPDGNYWWDGNDWQPVSGTGEPTTIPEVTVTGDPNSSGDPNSLEDAYADGYMTGSYGHDADASRYSPAAQAEYMRGWSAGGAQYKLTHHPDETGEVVGEGVAHVAAEGTAHALELGPLGILFAAFTMSSDTKLHELPIYICACGYDNHGTGHGDDLVAQGFWHGEPTLEYNDCKNEMNQHASTWNHSDAVSMFEYQEGNVTQI